MFVAVLVLSKISKIESFYLCQIYICGVCVYVCVSTPMCENRGSVLVSSNRQAGVTLLRGWTVWSLRHHQNGCGPPGLSLRRNFDLGSRNGLLNGLKRRSFFLQGLTVGYSGLSLSSYRLYQYGFEVYLSTGGQIKI